MRKLIALPAGAALVATIALPGGALGSSGRGLVGYIGLQAHGGEPDVVSFRNVRIRDLSAE
jgi:hypothetical protein